MDRCEGKSSTGKLRLGASSDVNMGFPIRWKECKRDSIAGSKRQLLKGNTIFWKIWCKVKIGSQVASQFVPLLLLVRKRVAPARAVGLQWIKMFINDQILEHFTKIVNFSRNLLWLPDRNRRSSVLKKCRQCWKQEYEHQLTVSYDFWISATVNNGLEFSKCCEKQSQTICRVAGLVL